MNGVSRFDDWAADVLVDDAGSDVGDFRALGEAVDDDGVEAVVVRHRYVDEEVFAAGDDEHADGFGQVCDPLSERVDAGAGRWPDEYRNECLDGAGRSSRGSRREQSRG
jgi:hypothetical protein